MHLKMSSAIWWPFCYGLNVLKQHSQHLPRADSGFAPSQWETALLCNDVSHWLGANLQSTLLTFSVSTQSLFLPPRLVKTSARYWRTSNKLRNMASKFCLLSDTDSNFLEPEANRIYSRTEIKNIYHIDSLHLVEVKTGQLTFEINIKVSLLHNYHGKIDGIIQKDSYTLYNLFHIFLKQEIRFITVIEIDQHLFK